MLDTTTTSYSHVHPSNHDHSVDSAELHQKLTKEIVLHVIAGLGIFSNAFLFICIISQHKMRQMSSAFILHNCFINSILAYFCSLFAYANDEQTTLKDKCSMLITAYMVLMTSGVLNILAMVCCELYRFGKGQKQPRVSKCCLLFNLFLIYGGSVLLHLGSTIIGGNFEKNDSSCHLIYKQRRNYIIIIMWMIIVSGVLAVCAYYLKRLYIAVQDNLEKRVFTMTKDSIQRHSRHDVSSLRTSTNTLKRHHSFKHLLRYSSNRAKVLTAVVVLHFCFWYPLFMLNILDPQSKAAFGIYEFLTFLGLTTSTIQPWIFLLADSQINRNLSSRLLSSIRQKSHEGFRKKDDNCIEMNNFSNNNFEQRSAAEPSIWSGTDWEQVYSNTGQMDNLQHSQISLSLTELISIYQEPSERAESFRLSE